MTDLRQDDLTIEMVGAVEPPPDLNLILSRIATAARFKRSVTLTPGEVRILTNHLEENQ